MTNTSLAQAYMIKASNRLKILPVLMEVEAWSDVIREAQECVELALKGMLRQVGIEPPKWHDVGELLEEHKERFPDSVRRETEELARISSWLRKEREISFYGDVDFIPTEQYSKDDAQRAADDAKTVIRAAEQVIKISEPTPECP